MPGQLGRRWHHYVKAYVQANPHCRLHRDGCTGQAQTVDHIVPRSLGGSMWDPTNHRPACHHCNTSRGNGTRGEHPASRAW